MPVRFLTDAVREQLSGFPAELDSEALDRFFTFSDADLAEISHRHGDGNRLGWALSAVWATPAGILPCRRDDGAGRGLWRSWPTSSASTLGVAKGQRRRSKAWVNSADPLPGRVTGR